MVLAQDLRDAVLQAAILEKSWSEIVHSVHSQPDKPQYGLSGVWF